MHRFKGQSRIRHRCSTLLIIKLLTELCYPDIWSGNKCTLHCFNGFLFELCKHILYAYMSYEMLWNSCFVIRGKDYQYIISFELQSSIHIFTYELNDFIIFYLVDNINDLLKFQRNFDEWVVKNIQVRECYKFVKKTDDDKDNDPICHCNNKLSKHPKNSPGSKTSYYTSELMF